MIKPLSYLLLAALLSACATTHLVDNTETSSDASKTAALYQAMIDAEVPQIAKLNLFLTKMPKGGDLHHHYSGTVYAETFLDWVGDKGWYIDSCTLRITKTRVQDKDCPSLSSQEVYQNDMVFRQLLQLWSDKDFANHYHEQPAPDTQFFNTFAYFGEIAHQYQLRGLQVIKARAIAENVGYIETMLSTTGVSGVDYYQSQEITALNQALHSAENDAALFDVFDQIREHYVANDTFKDQIQQYVDSISQYQAAIDDERFTMRYQTYAVRVLPPLHVFTDLLAGFAAADLSPYVVGVNIVAPENNHVALTDYTLHMKMYQYLHSKYPSVNRALHAGELTLGMVRPKDLLFHIHEAIDIAKAQRIGHGIDVVYEQDSIGLLEKMKQQAAVEINLTSNAFILGVEGQAHPYTVYEAYGVPMVISTDDSGVSRNNLTQEYMQLASRYKPSYETIKRYAYNSIDYSFMTEDDKARERARLDQRFVDFEQEMAALFTQMQ